MDNNTCAVAFLNIVQKCSEGGNGTQSGHWFFRYVDRDVGWRCVRVTLIFEC